MRVSLKRTKASLASATLLKPSLRTLSEVSVRPLVDKLWNDFDVKTSHGSVAVREGRGRGVPVVFLHGNSSSKDVFTAQMSGDLRETCRMIALDLPGHGDSADASKPERTYSIPGYADAVIEVLEYLDITRVVLVGWSLGGHIALEIAARYPGVLGILLCGTPPVGTRVEEISAGFRPSPELALTGQADMSPSDVRAFARLTVGDAARADTQATIARTDGRARALMFAHLLGGGVPDQRAFVEAATMPIAIVNGDDDPVVDVDYLKACPRGSLWYRRIHLIRNGGHAPFLTQPQAFGRVFARFLRSMRRRDERAAENPDLCFSG